jgi:hypothetical protein
MGVHNARKGGAIVFTRIRQLLGHGRHRRSDDLVAHDTGGEAFEDVRLDDFEASGGGVSTPLLPPGHHDPDAFEADSEAPRDPAP